MVRASGVDREPPHPDPPHLGRLIRRLAELPSPVIQVWGWPGTGKRALLEALLERQGPPGPPTGEPARKPRGARALARAELEGEPRIRETLDKPEVITGRWLVCLDLPAASLGTACRLLRPGQRLLGAGSRRLDAGDLPVSFLSPGELLLTREEGRELWRSSAPRSAFDLEAADRLWKLTGGWLTPLRLAARAVAEGALELREGAEGVSTDTLLDALLDLTPVRSFLRHEVLAPLPDEVRDALEARALGEAARGGARSAGEMVRRLAPWGWTAEGSEMPRVPELLRRFLRDAVSPGEPTSGEEAGEPPDTVPPGEPRASEQEPVRGPSVRGLRERPQARISLLGPPRVTLVPETEVETETEGGDEDEVEIHWPLKRALKILAYLASSEELQAPRDDITAALWPEDDEARIARNFHPTLSRLRRTFHEAWEEVRGAPAPTPLLFVHDSYRLNPDIVWEVDVVELSAAGERGRRVMEEDPEAAVELFRDAVGLVRGPFLAGTYDAWAEPLRERYQRRWLDLLRELADLYVRLDRLTEAVDAYRRILIEDPLREPVHQALMRVYAMQGRRDLVRRQYDRLANLLAEELGVEPLPQTTEEYHRLMG